MIVVPILCVVTCGVIYLFIRIVLYQIVQRADADRILMQLRLQTEYLVLCFAFFAQSPDFAMKLPVSYLQ